MTTASLPQPAAERAFSLSCTYWLETVTAALEEAGIFAAVCNDLHLWKDYMSSRPDRAGLMPVLNPDVPASALHVDLVYLPRPRRISLTHRWFPPL
jgi:hypothetical protein